MLNRAHNAGKVDKAIAITRDLRQTDPQFVVD